MIINFNFFWIAFFIVLAILIFLIHNGININLFVKKDEHIASEFFKKFPLVKADFYTKTAKEQIIENNQEIHENNLEMYDLKKRIEELEIGINKILWELEKCKKK